MFVWPRRSRSALRSSSWEIRTAILATRISVAVCEIFTYKAVYHDTGFHMGFTRMAQCLTATLTCRALGIILPAVTLVSSNALMRHDPRFERLDDRVRRILDSLHTVRAFAIPLYIILVKGRFSGGNGLFLPRIGHLQETCGPGGCYDELFCYLTVSLAVLALHRSQFLQTICPGPDSFTASFLQLSYATVFAAVYPPAAVIAYIMISAELRAGKRCGYFPDIVPHDLDEWCEKFSSLTRAVVFVNTLVLAFGSEIVPMSFYAHRMGSLEGYTDFVLQSVKVDDENVSTNGTTCFVHTYTDFEKRDRKFNNSHHVFLFRIGFAVVFQNLALVITTFINQHA